MDNGLAIAAVITSVTGALTTAGAGLVWLVRLIQSQSASTVDAKNTELREAHGRIDELETGLDETRTEKEEALSRVRELEDQLHRSRMKIRELEWDLQRAGQA